MSAGAFIVEDAFPNLILAKVKERVRIERIEFAVDDSWKAKGVSKKAMGYPSNLGGELQGEIIPKVSEFPPTMVSRDYLCFSCSSHLQHLLFPAK